MLLGPESCEKRSSVTYKLHRVLIMQHTYNIYIYVFELPRKVLLVVVIFSVFVQCLCGLLL